MIQKDSGPREETMNEIREIHTYEDTASSSNSTMLGIFIVAIVAILGIALALWQPWAPPTTSTDTTHIITQPAAQPDTTIVNPPNTTIVNPPAQTEPSKTEVNINGGGGTSNDTSGTTGSGGN
jgi:hypothetical protein